MKILRPLIVALFVGLAAVASAGCYAGAYPATGYYSGGYYSHGYVGQPVGYYGGAYSGGYYARPAGGVYVAPTYVQRPAGYSAGYTVAPGGGGGYVGGGARGGVVVNAR